MPIVSGYTSVFLSLYRFKSKLLDFKHFLFFQLDCLHVIVSLYSLKQFYDDSLTTRVLDTKVTLPSKFDEEMILSIMDKTNMEHLYESVDKKEKFSPFKR